MDSKSPVEIVAALDRIRIFCQEFLFHRNLCCFWQNALYSFGDEFSGENVDLTRRGHPLKKLETEPQRKISQAPMELWQGCKGSKISSYVVAPNINLFFVNGFSVFMRTSMRFDAKI
jgi:hypothetical protein